MKTVIFDGRWPNGTGIGVVSAQIRPLLQQSFDLIDARVAGRVGHPLSPLYLTYALATQKKPKDSVFWNPGFIPSLWPVIPSVVTVHDLTHLHYYSRFHKAYYEYVFKRLYKGVDKIVCVSEFTRKEFCSWSGIDIKKTTVIYNGVSPIFNTFPAPSQYDFPYICYPGNYRSYKNLLRLIVAYAQSDLPSQGIRLVLTGSGSPELRRIALEAGVGRYCIFTGYLDEGNLSSLYKNAVAVAFISLYEGFGLPLIEGMASWVPVLSSNSSCLPEIAGNAAFLVDGLNISEISAGLNTVAFDKSARDELIQRGLTRCRDFLWQTSAQRLASVIEGL